MPDKITNMQALAIPARADVTSGVDKWLAYLESTGRLYRHGYTEQLLIHAQKPGASYCLDLNSWKEARRIVRTGSKSIAVPQDVGGAVGVRFLFDVSDTTPMRSTRPHVDWKLDEAGRADLFGRHNASELKDHIMGLTLERVKEYTELHDEVFAQIRDGMTGEDVNGSFSITTIDEFAGVSAAYAVFSRTGSDVSVFDMEDFYDLQYFSSPAMMDFYAAAMSYAAGKILRDIEQDVTLGQRGRLAKFQIPGQNNAREAPRPLAAPPALENPPAGKEKEGEPDGTDLSPAGELPVPEPDSATTQPTLGQIRHDAPEIPDGAQAGRLRPDGDGGHSDEPPSGDRPDDAPAGGAEHDADAGDPAATGQEQRPAGLDRPHEQPEKPRGRTGAAADGVQQLSLFGEPEPPQEESKPLSSFLVPGVFPETDPATLSSDEIDDILRHDRFLAKTKGQILAYFRDHPSTEERAGALESAYDKIYIGLLRSDGQRFGYHKAENVPGQHPQLDTIPGLELVKGDFMDPSARLTLTWEDAAARVANLIENGTWFQDFPENDGRTVKPTAELSMTDDMDAPAAPVEVTPEDIRYILLRGSGYGGSKMRIYELYQGSRTPFERVKWLKNEYGTGGSTITYPDGTRGSHWHDSKGIGIEKSPASSFTNPDMVLKWPQIDKELRALVLSGQYLAPLELEAYNHRQDARALESQLEQHLSTIPVYLPITDSLDWRIEYKAGDHIYLNGSQHEILQIDGNGDMWSSKLDEPIKRERYTRTTFEYALLRERYNSHLVEFAQDEADQKVLRLAPGDVVYDHKDRRLVVSRIDEDTVHFTEAEIDGELTHMWFARATEVLPRNAKNSTYILPAEGVPPLAPLPDMTDEVLALAGDIYDQLCGGIDAYHLTSRMHPEERDEKVLAFATDILEGKAHALRRSLQYEFSNTPTEYAAINLFNRLNARLLRQAGIEHTPIPTLPERPPAGKRKEAEQQAPDSSGAIVLPADDPDRLERYATLDIEIPDASEDIPIGFGGQVSVQIDPAELPDLMHEIPPVNYRIVDTDLGKGGAKTKFGRNIAAIRVSKELSEKGWTATPEEQETLAQYVGWGSLPAAFDERNAAWANEYTQLKDLLDDREYTAARASTLTAFYTPPTVISAIYQALENMGFSKGNMLDPGMGTGNFFGLLPESMQGAKLYGVEIDPLTGAIAKQLYPNADIRVQGYEDTTFPDAFFDVAVGNVPFGAFTVPDKRYDKQKLHIHDYYFIKTLDKVRPGGVIAFVTSKGTLDKPDETVRRAIAEQTELLGAIRLPNTAFKENAGTEVTSDILFLQKKERPTIADPDWLRLGKTEEGVPVNQYFLENPHMLLGKMVFDESMYGDKTDTACHAFEGAVLSEQLAKALQSIGGEYREPEPRMQGDGEERPAIEADPNVQNFSYTIVVDADNPKGVLYYRENSLMHPVVTSKTALERIRGMVELRDCTRRLIQLQLDGAADPAIAGAQKELNLRYDTFTKKYGLINSRANKQAFSDDGGYYLLCSLEILDENGELDRKADMFSKRTIRNAVTVTEVETPSEALAISITERARVDLDFMHGLLGERMEIPEITEALNGVIYHDPLYPKDDLSGWKPADEYLSGDVREKLRAAELVAEADPAYAVNVEALRAVQPKDLEASEIDVRLGATWIPTDDIKAFMNELLGTSVWSRDSIKVVFSPITGQWSIRNKSADGSNVKVNSTYGTYRAGAYRLLEDALNLRATKIWDKKIEVDGTETRVLNKQETMLAQQKQEQIKEAFKDWIFTDPDRRRRLVVYYNEHFNNIRPREYDGRHIQFVGMNPEITLGEHQRNAVARVLYGGNALLAHVVGAGKTFEMVAAAMESKRLGLCNKSLVVVPNHLTEQWASEWMQLYPNANILVSTKQDFTTANRKKFCGRIATGDYDAIIIGHSQFEKIPISRQRQIDMIERQIEQIMFEIRDMKEQRAENFTIKQAERTRKGLEARLKKLNDNARKDDVVTFEELGTDRLFVDEAHGYKNLFVFSKMRNVAGISQSEAQKSTDLYMKCQYLDDISGGRGVVFATGTPISNSMVEMYTMMRYLQTHLLARMNLEHFDSWASTFGETVSAMELAPEGTGFHMKTRFAKFYNLPELMAAFKECADIQTADMLNLPVPKIKSGKPVDVVVEPTVQQKEMVLKLADRAQEVRDSGVDPKVDNMLKITNDGRKLALDQRLIDPAMPDDPASKLNACISNVHRIWEETAAGRCTQMVFCDLSTPKRTIEYAENPDTGEDEMNLPFNVYWDIYEKLGARGVPGREIAFIHDAKSEVQKAELFARVRSGQVRVLIGSTFKMGAGTNVQRLLKALHHLDVPWRPSDIEQREGRMVRQGNLNEEVEIYRYVTKGTFDAYSWGLIENKQKFISQIMTSKSPVRSCEDVDESVLSYAEIKALATGNPHIKEKFDIEMEVAKLKLLKGNHQNNRFRLEDALTQKYPLELQAGKERVEGLAADLGRLNAHTRLDGEGKLDFEMMVNEVRYTDKEKAGKAILLYCAKAVEGPVEIGVYRGFRMQMEYEALGTTFKLHLIGALRHTVSLGADDVGNITRINNGLDGMADRLEKAKASLAEVEVQMANAKTEIEKPFPREEELSQKQTRLIELVALLKIDEKQMDIVDDGVVEDDAAPSKQRVRVGAGVER